MPDRIPGWHLLALVAGLAAALFCAGPVSDPDVFWHVEAGAYTLHGQRFPFPDPWSYSLPDAHWHSTAWLSELILAAVQRSSGWLGIVVLRAAITAWIVMALYRLLVRPERSWTGPVVFLAVVLPISRYVQERPQTASLLFLVWLAAIGHRFLTTGARPRRWRFVAMTYLWALLHGLFVLAPAILVLLALGALLARGRAAREDAAWLTRTALLATAGAALTPLGPRLLLAPITVGNAAKGMLAEWLPTNLTVPGAWGFAAVLAILLVCWARSTRTVPLDQLLFVVVLTAFGFLVIRNAGVVSILLAPLAVDWLGIAFGGRSELTVPRRAFACLAVLGAIAVAVSYLRWPVLPEARPAKIAQSLAAQPGQLRVLNDYNISGYLISSTSGHVKLLVDGRADRYGHAFLERERAAVQGGIDWQPVIREYHPDVAVIGKDSPLAQLLVAVEGWHVVMTDHAFQLLSAPGVTLSPP